MSLPHCPKCNSEYTYEDNGMYICRNVPTNGTTPEPAQESDELNGRKMLTAICWLTATAFAVIKDLKVKGSSSMLKIGTKVKNIRLVEGDHNIDCKIDGFGPMKLKSGVCEKELIVL